MTDIAATGAQQLDLFEHVLEAYRDAPNGTLTNRALYREVASRAGVPEETFQTRSPVGRSGKPHSLSTRAVRWHQQSLKHMQVLERVPGERGVWELAERNKKGLHAARHGVHLVAFSTRLGVAIWGSCETALAGLDQQISLVVTSPPYPLRKARDYGNPTEQQFTDFICRALEPTIRHLTPGASLCLNLGNDVFLEGLPARSLYRERAILALCDRFSLFKMDSLVWVNRSKPPGPIEWASKRRVQLNVAYETIDWLTNDPAKVKADNRRVLLEHSDRHLALIRSGGEQREACNANGAYRLSQGAYANPTTGRIPRNVIESGHRCADANRYRADARRLGLAIHGARQPLTIPDFLVRFLSEVDDLVFDPFGGTCTTAMAAERNDRRWLVTELMLDYLRGGAERFAQFDGFGMAESIKTWQPNR